MSKWKFSVVIPIYNVEDYLEETILSVTSQSIGFKENIQIILINDGSPDKSEEICLKYKMMYPDNITYIKQQNQGVSSARNKGMEFIDGKYVNFLDSDDKWPQDAFEKVYKFFKENEKHIDVVACPLEYFEAQEGMSHPLNFKFNKDKVIDIRFSPDQIQMHMASCFIKAKAIDNKFNANLKFGEDSLFITQIILKKGYYGALSSIHYLYRKRLSETSALDTCQTKKEFYNPTLENFHFKLLDYCIQNKILIPKQEKIIPYIQYILMYDLQWRVKRIIPDVIDESEKFKYIDNLRSILKHIDDYVIASQKTLSVEHKIYALSLKHKKDISCHLNQRRNDFYFNNILLFSGKNKAFLRLSQVDVKDNKLHVEGIINTPIPKSEFSIKIVDNNENEYPLQLVDYAKNKKVNVEGHYYYLQYFKQDIPINNILKIKFLLVYQDGAPIMLDVGNTSTCALNTSINGGFIKTKTNIVEYKKCRIIVRNNSKKLHLKLEAKYDVELFKKHYRRLTLYRIARFILYYLIKKDIWIISDRPEKAGDNGEAFFEYMQTVKNKNIKVYFALDKSSEDYGKMKKIGKVLAWGSIKYKLMFLVSSKIISSQASDYIINPFGKNHNYMKDLYMFDFIFLQHGITKDDISNWLNVQSKKIDMFVTAGIPEYNSIVNGDYYYGKDVVKLTGFPRHDNLIASNTKTKKIAIIPTWRKSIPNCVEAGTDKSIYNPRFKESDFFKFYNGLINDERLLKVMKDNRYVGLFCLHPLFKEQASHFQGNNVFDINKSYVDYQNIFKNYDLLVTDYSSVFFDFAYLDKPVAYSQFDAKEFFSGHSYEKGYFSYEDDGFGPVSHTLDDAVHDIIGIIQNGCIMDEVYKERVERFYPKDKGHNCKNVYEEILKMP